MKILWIPHTGWHIPQRAHLFSRALSEKHEVHVTDWVADFKTIQDYVSYRYLRNFTYRNYHDGSITVHCIPRISPALFSKVLRRINTVIYSWFIKRIIELYGIDVVIGTFVVPPPKAPRLIFDLFDENVAYWRSFGKVPTYADEIERTEMDYLQTADIVVAASSVLMDKVTSMGIPVPVKLIPNGVDLHKFDNTNRAFIRHKLGVEGYLVGSVGNHDKTIELEKILDVARLFINESVTFLIAGRGSAIQPAKKRVQRDGLTNVIFMGYVPSEQVPEVISALDIGLCPYFKTPGADAGSPMRLLLYLAAGLPVVCTNLEEVKRMHFNNVVLVDDDSQSLGYGIREALQLPKIRDKQIEEYDLVKLVSRWESILA